MWPIQNDAENLKNDWKPGTWVLIWECAARAVQWISTWQGLEGFQNYLHLCVWDESCLSIESINAHSGQKKPDNLDEILKVKTMSGKYFKEKY